MINPIWSCLVRKFTLTSYSCDLAFLKLVFWRFALNWSTNCINIRLNSSQSKCFLWNLSFIIYKLFIFSLLQKDQFVKQIQKNLNRKYLSKQQFLNVDSVDLSKGNFNKKIALDFYISCCKLSQNTLEDSPALIQLISTLPY